VDVPGIFVFERPVDGVRSIDPDGRSEIPCIWLPKVAAVSRLKWSAGTYSVAHVLVGGELPSPDESLPDDLLHPRFLGGIDLTGGQAHDKLIYVSDEQASSIPRKRRKARNDDYKFTAAAGRSNEWRISIPSQLVELLTAPQVQERDSGSPALDADTLMPAADVR
jgi:hypothetical protein